MRTCPHCSFLVNDGATECSVCHQSLTREPVAAGSVAGAAPLPTDPFGAPPAANAGPSPFGPPAGPGGYPPAPGQPGLTAPPEPRKKRTGLIIAVVLVGAFGFLTLASIAVVALLGEVAGGEIVAEELDWTTYEDPDGRFSVELPGDPYTESTEIGSGWGNTVDVDAVTIDDLRFRTTVVPYPDAVLAGMTFEGLPFDEDAVVRTLEASGFEDVAVVSTEIVPDGTSLMMEIELTGVVDGEDAVLISRLVIAGSDLYELFTAGPADQRGALLDIAVRVNSSFDATGV